MMRKLVQGLIVSGLIVIVPTWGHPELLGAFKLWVLVALGVAALVGVPEADSS
jgi:hypothetical protein